MIAVRSSHLVPEAKLRIDFEGHGEAYLVGRLTVRRAYKDRNTRSSERETVESHTPKPIVALGR